MGGEGGARTGKPFHQATGGVGERMAEWFFLRNCATEAHTWGAAGPFFSGAPIGSGHHRAVGWVRNFFLAGPRFGLGIIEEL